MAFEFEAALSPEAIIEGGGGAYLEHLAPSKDKYDGLYQSAVQDGRGLVEIFSKPPVDPQNPVSKISEHLSEVEKGKKKVDALWAESLGRGVAKQSESVGQSPGHYETTPPEPVATPPGPVQVARKVKSDMKTSDRFSELEEAAYEVRGGCGLCCYM